jgi:hypothetical protein
MLARGSSRRAAAGAFAAAIAAAAVAGHDAIARPAQPFPNIKVDVSPLRANSGDPTARWVAEDLPGAIAEALARRGAPNIPIAVSIDYSTLGPNSGGTGPTGASPDNIRGVATIRGLAEPVSAQSWYYINAADAAMIEESNHWRVRALVQALAYWIAQDAAQVRG